MTISSEDRKAGPFTGNGSTTSFPFDFKVFDKEDLQVILKNEINVETTLVLDSDYSVTLNADQDADPGGTVTYPISGDALPSTETLTVLGALEYLQPTDITNSGGFYPQVIENALDRQTILTQQLKEKVERTLTLAVTTPDGVSPSLPAPSSLAMIGWNDSGTALQNVDPNTLATIVAYGTANADKFTGDGATTEFYLSDNPGALNNLDVSVDGLTRTPGVDYAWDGGNLVTFTTAPGTPSIPGEKNVLIRYMQGLPQGVSAASSVQFDMPSGGSSTVQSALAVLVETYAAVRLMDAAYSARYVTVQGRLSALDGGHGVFLHDPSDTSSMDDGAITLVDVIGRRWKRLVLGIINVQWFGVRGDRVTNNTTTAQAAIDYAASIGASLFWPLSQGQVYRIDGSLDAKRVAFIGDAGPERIYPSAYTFNASTIKACIYLAGATSSISDLVTAKDLSIVCNRPVHTTDAVKHTKRYSLYFDHVCVYHAGQDNISLPYGAIPLVFSNGSISDRARRYGLYANRLDDGTGAPDRDTNRVDLTRARLGYNRRGNFRFEGSGGVFLITGADITKAGEPDDVNPADTTAYAVYVNITSGSNSSCFTLTDTWLEKNYNLVYLGGTFRSVTTNNLRVAAYGVGLGTMFTFGGFVYDFVAERISNSGPAYQYLFDATNLGFETASTGNTTCWGNNITIAASVRGWANVCDYSVAANKRFIRSHGGFDLEAYPAGTVTGKSGSAPSVVYTVDLSKIPTGSATAPINGWAASWFVNAGQAPDISAYINGVYAGEIVTAVNGGTPSITLTKDVTVGAGQLTLYVRRKTYVENQKPLAYSQNSNVAL